jgi:hypothetical protein
MPILKNVGEYAKIILDCNNGDRMAALAMVADIARKHKLLPPEYLAAVSLRIVMSARD